MLCWDLETERFGPSNLAPEPICIGVCDGKDTLVVAACEPEFDDVLEHCLRQEQVNMNIAFDMSVVLAHRPHLAHLVWKSYEDRAVYDIAIREKLISLATFGDLEFLPLPNGAKSKLDWSQAGLEKRLLGIDRSAEKDDEDSFRTNFATLRTVPASEYPKEALDYVKADAVNALRIYHDQQRRAAAEPISPFPAQHLHVRASLALYLSSCWGFPVDREMVDRLIAELGGQWHEEALIEVDGQLRPAYGNLLESGILRPSEPSRPYGNQLKKAEKILGLIPADWLAHRVKLEAEGIRFTEPKKSSYNEKLLKARVEEVCKRREIEPKLTEKGEISFDKEAQADLAGFDDALDEYIERKKIEKLVTTELPRMAGVDRVHPKYDVLKTTSRTSSYGNSKKDKEPAYAAVNIQQIDPRVREAYIASPGKVLCSTDYSAIELVSAAEKAISLFGTSVLAQKINAGYDPHAYLGASIARMLDPTYRSMASDDDDENYFIFKAMEDTADHGKLYEHYRKMAKPTGLGFPGGLGPKRFVGYAKSQYSIDMVKMTGSLEQAVELASLLKATWLETYPEMGAYFEWVKRNCVDIEWSTAEETRYAYSSPYGTVRRNCFYTEATNGAALQTPTAEGAKEGLWLLAKAMNDPSTGSILLGSKMLAFIHDETIVELDDNETAHDKAIEIAKLMVDGMRKVIKNVTVKAEPCLMFRWNKKAKPIFDSNNRLIPWLPKSKSA